MALRRALRSMSRVARGGGWMGWGARALLPGGGGGCRRPCGGGGVVGLVGVGGLRWGWAGVPVGSVLGCGGVRGGGGGGEGLGEVDDGGGEGLAVGSDEGGDALRMGYGDRVDEGDVAADAEGWVGEGDGDGVVECRAGGHEGR